MIVYRLRRKANDLDIRRGRGQDGNVYFCRDKTPPNVLTVYSTRKGAEKALAQVSNPNNPYEIIMYQLEEISEQVPE